MATIYGEMCFVLIQYFSPLGAALTESSTVFKSAVRICTVFYQLEWLAGNYFSLTHVITTSTQVGVVNTASEQA